MTLSTLIQYGGLSKVATATPATIATVPIPGLPHVATVATVAVADPREIAGGEVTDAPSRFGDRTPTSLQAIKLREQVRQARDWSDLDAVLDEAQAAFDIGDVTCEEVETLSGYAADISLLVPEQAGDEHLSALLARQPIVRVRSRLLGEVVVWVADAVEITEEIAEVVYRESELRRLVGRSPAELRAVHEVKRALDGEVM